MGNWQRNSRCLMLDSCAFIFKAVHIHKFSMSYLTEMYMLFFFHGPTTVYNITTFSSDSINDQFAYTMWMTNFLKSVQESYIRYIQSDEIDQIWNISIHPCGDLVQNKHRNNRFYSCSNNPSEVLRPIILMTTCRPRPHIISKLMLLKR